MADAASQAITESKTSFSKIAFFEMVGEEALHRIAELTFLVKALYWINEVDEVKQSMPLLFFSSVDREIVGEELVTLIPVAAYSITAYFIEPTLLILNKIPFQSPELGMALLEENLMESDIVPTTVNPPSIKNVTLLSKNRTTPGSMVKL